MNAIPKEILKESEIVSALEGVCQALELTPTQHKAAKEHYEAVGAWLADADNVMLRNLVIYPHGSTALGTTVKPHGRNEHDVDLVSHTKSVGVDTPPANLKTAIGRRLREHGYYGSILEEKRRCWRLNYAGEFHLDVTPSIRNPACANGGELVPDKELRQWKPTNPKGYLALFERRALLVPRIRFAGVYLEKRADVAPFPDQTILKGILRRIVQISKRHRDIYFTSAGTDLAPISVVLTTLIARAYESAAIYEYDTELQFVITVIRKMPDFIDGPSTTGHTRWAVWNETTHGENFAEKWNNEPALATAFFTWHSRLISDIEGLNLVYGLDGLAKSLGGAFGSHPAQRAMSMLTERVGAARRSGELGVAPRIGLSTSVATSSLIRPNTFFGAE